MTTSSDTGAVVALRFVEPGEAWDDATSLAVANDVDIESIAAELPRLRTVALAFPKWTDGRAYSQAHVLRTRLGFHGEIRATGEVVADMAPQLVRCGFDAAALRDGESPDTARRALAFFPDGHYQGDVNEPRPRFARLAAAAPR